MTVLDSTRRRRRILLVDDSEPSRTGTCIALSQFGHACEVADSAASALDAIVSFSPEIVLLEWKLRGEEGLGLAVRLRAAARAVGRALHIIVVSTQSEPLGFREAQQVEHYLVKPVAALEIDEIITHLI